jgi:hypothetical protein
MRLSLTPANGVWLCIATLSASILAGSGAAKEPTDPGSSRRAGVSGTDDVLVSAVATAVGARRAERRGNRAWCPECGVVESILETDPRALEVHAIAANLRGARDEDATSDPRPAPDGAAKRYVLTVRMSDGSTTTYDETTRRTWRTGQRVILVRAAEGMGR